MPFFAFLRAANAGSSAGGGRRPSPTLPATRRRCRSESQAVSAAPWVSTVPVGRDRCSQIAYCAEKNAAASSRIPTFGFFGSGTHAAPLASAAETGGSGANEKNTTTTPGGTPEAMMAASENEQSGQSLTKLQLTQPIPFEQFSREWMNISGQDSFDGFRLEGAKQVNKYLQTCHSFCLGTKLRESGYLYQFGPTLAISASPEPSQGENAPPPSPHVFAMAKLGTDGSLQGRLIKTLGSNADVKLNFNSSLKEEQRNFYELSMDNTGRDWATSMKLAWQSCWILDGMFSQVLTPRLQAGCEVTYVGANGASMLAVGGRYNLDKQSIVSCQLSQQPDFKTPAGLTKHTHSCKVQYVRKVTDRLSMATECEYLHPDMESSLRVGWEYLFRQARVQGLVDSCGRVSIFAQDYNGFGISGIIDYWRGSYKFGFLMHVVPPPDPQQQQGH